MSQKATTNMIYPSGSETNQGKVQIGKKNNSFATGTNAVYIGTSDNGYASGQYSVAIGPNAKSAASNSIALGYDTSVGSSYSYSVALGALSDSFRSNEVSVGRRNYTRYIANVTDPTNPQDASTKNYTDNLVISYSAIEGSSAPTTATEGKYVGQLYFDTTNDKKYYLKAIDTTTDPDTYTWEEFGGGGIPTDATFWGQSYDSVNNKVGDGGNIAIGTNASTASNKNTQVVVGSGARSTSGNGAVVIGANATASNDLLVVIGANATTGATGATVVGRNSRVVNGASHSVALGAYSVSNRGYEVSIGSGTAGQNYATRYLANVTDPTNPQDAATKNYVDTNLPSVGDATLTIQKNGVDVQTFTANSTTNATANIGVPTTVAELDDASDYAYAADLIQLESSLAEVALTGSHNDLSDVPTIDATISASSTNAVQNQAVAAALANKADSSSIGNGTLTIKRNGTSVATFSANSSTAAEADISVPTAVSQLSDASSYYTKTQVDDAISGAISASLKYKGSCTFANLPASGMNVGDVWNITDDFTLDGESYSAGTNIAWNGTKWDPLAPAIDLSPYELKTDVGNGTITIATATGNVDTFTTNQASNKTITIPAATASAHGTVIVDSALSASSNNPVRNSVIYSAIGDIETILNTLNSGTGA
jgi:hypothetical protein